MAKVIDVASYFLNRHGGMTSGKLQCLVYYAQAWHLVWDEEPLFEEEIQAWEANVRCPVLYRALGKRFKVTKLPQGRVKKLKNNEKDTIDAILNGYGKLTGHQLSDKIHVEDPWVKSRPRYPEEYRIIDHDAMYTYFSNL